VGGDFYCCARRHKGQESLAGILRFTFATAFACDEIIPVIAAFQIEHRGPIGALHLLDDFVDLGICDRILF
jgi:hypothetical protein